MGEHETRSAGPLLDRDGALREPGWSRRPLLSYDRAAVKAPAWRIKEWDYYCVLSDDYGIALTVADNGYMGFVAATVFDFIQGAERSESLMTPFPLGKFGLPADSREGRVSFSSKGLSLVFETRGGERRLSFSWPGFGAKAALKAMPRASCCAELPPEVKAEARRAAGPTIGGIGLEGSVTLREIPGTESMNIATPFQGRRGRFYFNRKINCLEAEGSFSLGKRAFAFERGKAFGVLDWGRGVWPWSNTWYWASASGWASANGGARGDASGSARGGSSGGDGQGATRGRFGFNLGYGFGDTSAASENAILWEGRLHKLGETVFEFDPKDLLSPWKARSMDGRLDLTMRPILDRASELDYGIIASIQHQVFGIWSGKAVLDDGTELAIDDLRGFAEKVVNRW